jgi:hypothetical protein
MQRQTIRLIFAEHVDTNGNMYKLTVEVMSSEQRLERAGIPGTVMCALGAHRQVLE